MHASFAWLLFPVSVCVGQPVAPIHRACRHPGSGGCRRVGLQPAPGCQASKGVPRCSKLNVSTWFHMVPHGSTWFHMVPHGSTWFQGWPLRFQGILCFLQLPQTGGFAFFISQAGFKPIPDREDHNCNLMMWSELRFSLVAYFPVLVFQTTLVFRDLTRA